MKDIEKNLKNRFKGQFIPVDESEAEDIWAGISKGLKPQPVSWYRKVNFVKSFLLFGIVSFIGFAVYHSTQIFSTDLNEKEFVENIHQSGLIENSSKHNDDVVELNSDYANVDSKKSDLQTGLEIKSNAQNSRNSLIDNSENNIKTSLKPKQNKLRTDSFWNSSSVPSYKKTSKFADKSARQSVTTELSNTIFDSKNSISKNSNSVDKHKPIPTESSASKSNIITDKVFNINGNIKLDPIRSLNLDLLSLPKTDQNAIGFIQAKESKEISIKKNRNWNLELFTGSNFMTFDYKSNENSELADLKNTADKLHPGHQYGIGLGYQVNPKLEIQTGLSYQKYWSKLDHEFITEELIEKKNQVIKVWLDANTLDTINQLRVDTVTTLKNTRKVIHHNRYEKLSIPLVLGYRIKMKQFSYVLSFGPSFNFYHKQEGRHINIDGELSDFSNDQGPIFKKFHLGINTKIGIYYHWNPHLDLYASPQFNFESNKLFEDKVGLNAHTVQINLGLRSRL